MAFNQGFIKHQGSFDTLTKTSSEFNNLLNAMKKNDDESPEDTTVTDTYNFTDGKNSFLRFDKSRTSRVSVRSQDSYQFVSNIQTILKYSSIINNYN